LKGNHGTDLSAVKNIKEQGFNDIVFVMTEGDFVTFETMGEMEQAFSSFPGTEETGVFSILRTVRPYPDIRELNVIRESFHFKKILQDFGSIRVKAKVNVNWKKFVMDGNSLAPFMEEVEKRQAIFSSRDPYQNAVSLLDQTITMDRFPHQTPDLFFPVSHDLNTRKAQRA